MHNLCSSLVLQLHPIAPQYILFCYSALHCLDSCLLHHQFLCQSWLVSGLALAYKEYILCDDRQQTKKNINKVDQAHNINYAQENTEATKWHQKLGVSS